MRPLCLLAGLLVSSTAFSQAGAPPDVPRNHWAFKAVDDLFRAGILHGYPDGDFRGDRPATRSELARVGAAQKLVAHRQTPTRKFATKKDVDALRAQISTLRESVDEMKLQHDELEAIRAKLESLHEQLVRLRGKVNAR